jgi:hypothetical protein
MASERASVVGYEASGALEAGRWVKLDGSAQLVYAGAGEQAIGVLEEDATRAGQVVGVVVAGEVKVQVAAALAAGVRVASDANGRSVAAVTASHFALGQLAAAGRAPVSSKYDRALVVVADVKMALPA